MGYYMSTTVNQEGDEMSVKYDNAETFNFLLARRAEAVRLAKQGIDTSGARRKPRDPEKYAFLVATSGLGPFDAPPER